MTYFNGSGLWVLSQPQEQSQLFCYIFIYLSFKPQILAGLDCVMLSLTAILSLLHTTANRTALATTDS